MLDSACAHKDHVCMLVYGLDLSGRVHVCKLCDASLPCDHFKVKPATLSYKHTRKQKLVEAPSVTDTDDLDSLI